MTHSEHLKWLETATPSEIYRKARYDEMIKRMREEKERQEKMRQLVEDVSIALVGVLFIIVGLFLCLNILDGDITGLFLFIPLGLVLIFHRKLDRMEAE